MIGHSSPPVGLFGKLPSHPDFVRLNAGGPLARLLDAWMQEGLPLLRSSLGSGWETAFDRTVLLFFAYRVKDPVEALVGVCRPGRDQGGRRYPFSIFAHAHLGRGGAGFQVLPQAYALFLKAARRYAVNECAEGIDNQKAAQIVNLSSILPQNLVEPQQRFDQYLGDVTMETFWRGIYGDFHDQRKYLVMKNLFATLAPRRGHDTSRFGFALRLPTGGDADAVSLQVSTWFCLCQATLGGDNLEQAALFWYEGATPAASGCYIFFRAPLPAMLPSLLFPGTENEMVWNLEVMGADRADTACHDLGEPLASILDSPKVTLKEFIKSVRA